MRMRRRRRRRRRRRGGRRATPNTFGPRRSATHPRMVGVRSRRPQRLLQEPHPTSAPPLRSASPSSSSCFPSRSSPWPPPPPPPPREGGDVVRTAE
eukprot:5359689-Pyramimonas_sp.AAC.1